jgi:hypothetical protein
MEENECLFAKSVRIWSYNSVCITISLTLPVVLDIRRLDVLLTKSHLLTHSFTFFFTYLLSFNRSLVQIKSHAQKVLKRLDVGENVFRRLEDNSQRLETLVVHIHEKLGLDSPPLNNFTSASSLKEQQQQLTKRRPNEQAQAGKEAEHIRPNEENQEDGGAEHIDAASALCQLAAPAGAWSGASAAPSAPFPRASAAPSAPFPQQKQDKAEFHSVVAAVNWIQP